MDSPKGPLPSSASPTASGSTANSSSPQQTISSPGPNSNKLYKQLALALTVLMMGVLAYYGYLLYSQRAGTNPQSKIIYNGNRSPDLVDSYIKANNQLFCPQEDTVFNNLEEALKTPDKVCSLDLSNNYYNELPSVVLTFKNTKVLYLMFNNLKALPDEFVNLGQLQKLYLTNNRLSQIPPVLFEMPWVKTLSLDGNQLTSISTEISNMTELQELYVERNEIKELPDQIGELKNLINLSISRNLVSDLPSSFANLTSLKKLSMDNNRFKEVPDEVVKLSELRTLRMANNEISSVPAEIGNLKKLTVLNLLNNKLTPQQITTIKNSMPEATATDL